MSVTRRLMKPGTWSLKMRPDTPHSITSQIGLLDHIVLLPTRLDPIAGFSDAGLLAAAEYSGVITKKPSATDLAGHGLEWWLGTPKGFGPGTAATQGLLTTPVTQTAATLSTWVAALCPPSLTVGTVTNGALPALTDSYRSVTRREALDAVVRQVGAEYRINPNGTIDAAAATTLFGSTATVVVTSKEEGRDGPYQGLEGSLIVTASDVDDYISKAIVVTRGEGSAATATTTTGVAGYRDFAGNSAHIERYIDAPTGLAPNAGLIGNAAIGKFNAVRRDLRLSSRTYHVNRFVEPGDYIFVYDPVQGLHDPANQIIYRGEVMTPLLLRVFGLTFPIESGSGVYVRRSTGVGTATWLDISDWVVWESGEVQWEVGTPRRPVVGTAAAQSEGTVAYLGVNPDIARRVAGTAGYIGRGGGFSPQTGITTGTDLADCSVSFTAPGGRIYSITAQCRITQQTSTSVPELELVNGAGTVIDKWSQTTPAGETVMAQLVGVTDIPSAGAVSYKLRLKTGLGTVDTVPSSTQPSRILVEDIGPA